MPKRISDACISTAYTVKKYGYKHIVEDLNFTNIEATYQKPYILLKYIHEFDYVVWVDLDAAIINDEIRLEDIITSYPDKDYLVFEDFGNWDLNAGILVFKKLSKQYQVALGMVE